MLKKLLNKLFGPEEPKTLKHLIKTTVFKEDLRPINMPHVGTYHPGSRTKKK